MHLVMMASIVSVVPDAWREDRVVLVVLACVVSDDSEFLTLITLLTFKTLRTSGNGARAVRCTVSDDVPFAGCRDDLHDGERRSNAFSPYARR